MPKFNISVYEELTIEKKERKFKPFKVVFALIMGIFIAIIIAYTDITEPKLEYVKIPPQQLLELNNSIQDPKEWRVYFSMKAKFQNNGFKRGFIDKIEIEPVGLTDYPEVEVINIDKTPIKWKRERVITYDIIVKMAWEDIKKKLKSEYQFKQLFYDNTGKQVHSETLAILSSWFKDLLDYPEHKSDKDNKIFELPIPKDIKAPDPLGIFNFDPIYKKARSFMLAEDYKNAEELFKSIYKIKPDYPTLALYYGICLKKVGKKDEALSVWLSIPPNEKYNFTNFNIGNLLYELARHKESVKYFKLALKDLKKNDGRYWIARARLIIAENKKKSVDLLVNDVNNFMGEVDKDLRNLTSYKIRKDTVEKIDDNEFRKETVGRKLGAFILLYSVSIEFSNKMNYSESLNYALRAADYVETPVFAISTPVGTINKKNKFYLVDKQFYLDFLQNLSFYLRYAKNRNYDKAKLNSTMERIEKNNCNENQEISDFAMLIRSFYGESKTIKQVKKASFEITYGANINYKNGIEKIFVISSDYLSGRKVIDVGGRQKYHFEENVTLNPKSVISEEPIFFKIRIEPIKDRIAYFVPIPWIKIKK